MLHTPLHRLLGEQPGPLTEKMIDDAIRQGLVESDELDWKKHLPAQKDFKTSDIVKDIAAMANTGGGMLVFGVEETAKAASGRLDAGDLTEGYERTIQQVCFSAISPPILGVKAIAISPATSGDRAVAIVVPASVDGPHLLFDGNKQTFSAPMRVNADTQWMNERLIEANYRTRFEAARRGREHLDALYQDMANSFDASLHAVLVGAARPRVPRAQSKRRDQYEIPRLIETAELLSKWWLTPTDYHPLIDVSGYSARPGLHGWVVPPSGGASWRPARAAIFDDGGVGLAWKAGGHRYGVKGDELEP